MILITLIAFVLSIGLLFNLPAKLTEQSHLLHHFCLLSLPKQVENLSSLETLVCGNNMQDFAQQQLLVQSSLIHIFIVSGTHFILLHKILAKIFGETLWNLAPLCIYAMMTLCQPPSLRSLIFLVLVEITRTKKLFTSPTILVLLSGVFSVAIFPQWITSRSLLMSLMAALTVSILGEAWGREQKSVAAFVVSQAALYFVMGFCLWGISNLHPLSILMNVALGPVIGAILFPLSLLIVAVPFLSPLFDGLLNSLFWILKRSSEILNTPAAATPLSVAWQWAIFFALIILSYYFLLNLHRKKYEA